ncbi:MAG TPA: tRNA threonylcarbamoyladenosine dehydratase [Firmicutes bacterium]|jgi:tRNA A37 threonylcarbamoyladenosine dehydratase|nr:tRNA threonylcarbamoyladenosine dehydratase [Bacillota bacterium]
MTVKEGVLRFSRTEQLIGADGLMRLRRARIAVVGVGGVGSYVVEALARAGVGWLVLVDSDQIELSNTNRQLHALAGNYGRPKVEVMAERITAINPEIIVVPWQTFVRPENVASVLQGDLSYIVDAVDTVAAKVAIIRYAREREIPVISAMGAGNKLDPSALKVADLSKTHTCPLAKAVRKALRSNGITDKVKVVFSTEPPLRTGLESPTASPSGSGCAACPRQPEEGACACPRRRPTPGTISYMPSIMGLLIAAEVIRDLLRFTVKEDEQKPEG